MTDRSNYTSDLPAGWCTATLVDVTQINAPLPQAELDDETEVSFLAMRSVEEETGRFDTSVTRTVGSVKRGYTSFVDGDVIFAKITPCMENGKFAVVRNLKNGIGFGSTEFHVLRAEAGILNQFLFFYLVQKSFRHEAQSKMTGSAGQKRVPTSFVGGTRVPIPPINEQQRIVSRVEELFTQLDAAVEELQKAQAQLKRYRHAVLKAAVTGELTREWREAHKDKLEPASELLTRILEERRTKWESEQLAKFTAAGKTPQSDDWRRKYRQPSVADDSRLPELPKAWMWTSLDQLLGILRNGISTKPTAEVGTPILRISSLRPMSVDLTDRRFLPRDYGPVDDYILQEGDLLFTRYNGNRSLVGVCGVVPAPDEQIVHPDKLIRGQVASDSVSPRFLQIVLNAGESRAFISKRARTTAGQTGISGGDLRVVPTPLAPFNEQEVIVQEVERCLSIIESTEKEIARCLRESDRIRQSTLKKAFEGKLVAQDPNDEPAKLLLERIKTERAMREAEKQAEAKSNRKPFTRKRLKRTERPAA